MWQEGAALSALRTLKRIDERVRAARLSTLAVAG
jgi:hypothetical protein